MKVLLANSEPGFRGGEFQTLALARGLRREGCEVMIAARAGSALGERAAGEIPVAEFPFDPVCIVTPVALARLVSRFRPAVLHAQTSDAHTHLWLARGLVREAPPLVVSRRVAFPIRKDALSFIKYRTRVAHYIPISRAAAESLLERGVSPSRMTVVPSGVDVASFAGASADAELGRRWGIAPGDFVVGTVAAFETEKGHRTLVRSAAAVLKEYPRSRFILVGDGALGKEIEAEAARVGGGRILCVPPAEALERVLPLFDVFVLPSLREGLSTALIAAMASGRAVVASMTGGIPEVVTAGSGILVPPGDVDALARAILTLAGDEGLRKTLADAARRRGADFDMRRTVEGTLEIYRLVAHTGSP